MKSPLLGIFGGSFDPVHVGHLNCIHELQLKLPIEKIHFIPCAQSALKAPADASAEDRLAMLQLATYPHKNWIVDDREIQRQGVSYTIDTLQSLKQDFPAHHLALILSMDTAIHLPQWHRWEELFDYAHLIILNRPGFILPDAHWVTLLKDRVLKNPQDLQTQPAGGVWWQNIIPLEVSSTEIRDLCQQQKTVPLTMLPMEVLRYIQQHKLYGY